MKRGVFGSWRKCGGLGEKVESKVDLGTALVVQRLRLQAPNAGGPGLIPGREARSHIPQLRVCMLTLKRSYMPQVRLKMKIEDPPCCNKEPVQPNQ